MLVDELKRKIEIGDLDGLLQSVVRLWLAKRQPWASYAMLLVGNGVEDCVVPIRGEPAIAAVPSQRVKLFQAE